MIHIPQPPKEKGAETQAIEPYTRGHLLWRSTVAREMEKLSSFPPLEPIYRL